MSPSPSSHVITVNGTKFDAAIVDERLPVLVDFWAQWCGPCLRMAPVLDELSLELKDSIKIAKVNVDDPENQQLAMKYQIRSIPNMKLFKNGAVIAEFIGWRSKEQLKSELEAHTK